MSTPDQSVFDEAAWERTPEGVVADVVAPPVARVTPLRSRLLASAKMTEVALISADFGTSQVVLEPWLMVLADTADGLDFQGIYRSAFEPDASDPRVPRLGLRTATWNARADEEHLRDEANAIRYVNGPEHAACVTAFVSAESVVHLTALIDELARAFQNGLTSSEVRRPAPGLHHLRLDLFETYAHFACSYSPYRLVNDWLEEWLNRWRAAIASRATASALASHRRPEGGWRISYHPSFEERLRRLR